MFLAKQKPCGVPPQQNKGCNHIPEYPNPNETSLYIIYTYHVYVHLLYFTSYTKKKKLSCVEMAPNSLCNHTEDN